jgi:hypothetical protein
MGCGCGAVGMTSGMEALRWRGCGLMGDGRCRHVEHSQASCLGVEGRVGWDARQSHHDGSRLRGAREAEWLASCAVVMSRRLAG